MSSNAVASSSKHSLDASQPSSKKHKSSSSHRSGDRESSKSSKHKHKDKHGHKHKHRHHDHGVAANGHAAVKSRKTREGPFEHRRSKMRISIPPKFGGDYMAGVHEILNSMIMRYVPQLDGVLLAHWKHLILDDTVKIINECPFGVCEAEFDALLWAPKIGQKLYGTHSLSSPSHLSLLFSKTFNISIPLNHIPPNEYEFEHTALDPDAEEEEDDGISDSEDEFAGPQQRLSASGLMALGGAKVHEAGRWKSKATGKLVGDGGKGIKFTVIGMQVTNQMLSLTGSLLDDPSSAPPPTESQVAARTAADVESSPEPEDLPHGAKPAISAAAAAAAVKKQVRRPRPDVASAAARGQQPPAFASTTGPTPTDTDGAAMAAPPTIAPQAAATAAAAAAPYVDDRFLSARELKQRRKDEERAKREARKARKVEGQIEAVQAVGAGAEVGITDEQVRADIGETAGVDGAVKDVGGGMDVERKRKADGASAQESGKKKKRKA